MSDHSKSLENELDLGGIIAVLWSHKTLIILITSLSILYAGYTALTADKTYTAKAVFKIQEDTKNEFSVSSELSALASIAGMSGQENSSTKALLERMETREFIKNVGKKILIKEDRFFNTYNPDYKDPLWKSTIKEIVSWKSITNNPELIIENNIVKNYRKFITFGTSRAGAISVSVTHENPNMAASYANQIMEYIRNLVELENRSAQSLRLTYLSETLADSLQDMEEAQQKLKEYALTNDARAQENFLSGSLKLDELREEKREAKKFLAVLNVLSNLINTGDSGNKAYQKLRSNYPIVDDVNFRRILGMSETISAWSWPDLETSQSVSATLKDRISRLDVEIGYIENSAKIYASKADDLAKLNRNAKIAEATYTVLIEQVKSHSLAAGFKPDTFKVYEYATPPVSPSSPNRKFIVAFGAAMGFIASCAVTFLNFLRKGVFYTRSSLLKKAVPLVSLGSNNIRRVARLSAPKMSAVLSKQYIPEINEAEISLSNEKLIFVQNAGGRIYSGDLARLLATKSACSGRKVCLCDLSNLSNNEIESNPNNKISNLTISTSSSGFDILESYKKPNGVSFFTSAEFKEDIDHIISNYQQVYIAPRDEEAMSGLIALKQFKPALVINARLRKTRKTDIDRINSIQKIGILFHD